MRHAPETEGGGSEGREGWVDHLLFRGINAAFHWVRKLVFTSFPVGNTVPLKSEMSYFQVGNLGVLRAPRNSDSEIRVGKYELLSPVECSISCEFSTKHDVTSMSKVTEVKR